MSEQERVFVGGGELGALMRALDWRETALGPVEHWPAALRIGVSTLLASPQPMGLYWGPELIHLYNDAYRPLIGDKHPALGRPSREVFQEFWDLVGPMLARVRETMHACSVENQRVLLDRRGFLEECFYTWSYVPTRDERGDFAGIVVTGGETTRQVLGERRFTAIRELSIHTARDTTPDAVFQSVERALAPHGPTDLPFVLLYRVEQERAALRVCTGLGRGDAQAPAHVALADPAPVWPLAEVLASGQERLVEAPPGRAAGPEGATRALLLPLSLGGEAGRETGVLFTAVLVVGLSPRLPLDASYRDFLSLLARQVAADVARARASQEERLRLERLAELDRAKTAFFSNISHEFRTPLTLMLGPVEDALADPDTPLPLVHRERLALVHRNGLRLFKLVNSLLGFARMEAGRATLHPQATDLAAFTAELVSHFESAFQRAGLTLGTHLPPLTGPVWVDPAAWETIVFNLLSNALKYTLEGGVTVRLVQEGAEAVLTVRDTGAGIPPSALSRVFERFQRVEGTRARSDEGSGIGLFLVHELTRLQGGSVTASSGEGLGTTFTVRLPFGTAPQTQEQREAGRDAAPVAPAVTPYLEEIQGWLAPTPPLPPPAGSTPRARVLVVDDNADMRAYLAGILRASFEVSLAEDGARALEVARQEPPALILSDVMMPRLGGFGLLRAVRATPELQAVPFLLLSARAGEEASVEGLEAGADDYMVKPFGARELLARVRAHLDLARLRREVSLAEGREATLREAVHARDDFLSVASHELKTPLAALRLQLETLERMLPAEVRVHAGERIFSVRRQIQRLASLIETMLDVSLVASGRLRIKRQPVDLAVLVADSVAQVREEMARHDCALTFESEASLPGELDALRVGQLVQNLLSNAARYGTGRPVLVRLGRMDGRARLEVVDHGIGVKPEDRERIFHRFERAVSVRHYGGLGLGLWVSRQVVEAHGGSITVSDTPGGGATLTVELPLHTAEA
ncbi:ATP-binding protein [Archangium primigenium]|uniref:hybrid sensor histidine kinase/response regulator n=1 Tax=[Archangium] primigenium TaxID=2792470 RepID=UPI0030840477